MWSWMWSKVSPYAAPGFPETQKTLENQRFSSVFMVEISGIEPLTSWMPFKRSPSWAIPPYSVVLSDSLCIISSVFRFVNTFFEFWQHFFCLQAWQKVNSSAGSKNRQESQQRNANRILFPLRIAGRASQSLHGACPSANMPQKRTGFTVMCHRKSVFLPEIWGAEMSIGPSGTGIAVTPRFPWPVETRASALINLSQVGL